MIYTQSIEQQNKYVETSRKYVQISTRNIIDELQENGWDVHRFSEMRVRNPARRGFQKHMVTFRRPFDGDEIPEIVLLNSHDGSSAYQLYAGIFRLVCANGMVVPDSLISKQSIRHTGDIMREVIEGVEYVVEHLPVVTNNINKLKSVTLDNYEQSLFAREAFRLKWPDIEPSTAPLNELLRPVRHEDTEDSVWNILNRVQEKLVYGSRSSRQVRSINGFIKINRGLWNLAKVFGGD